MVVYMFFSFLQLAVGSRDLSGAEKERNNGKAEQIRKMTNIFTQNYNFFITKTSLANKWMRKKYLLAVIQL